MAAVADEEQRSMLTSIMSNARASERFLGLARDLDVMAPRTPEEVQPQSVLRLLERFACDSAGWRDGGWATRPSTAGLLGQAGISVQCRMGQCGCIRTLNSVLYTNPKCSAPPSACRCTNPTWWRRGARAAPPWTARAPTWPAPSSMHLSTLASARYVTPLSGCSANHRCVSFSADHV